MGIPVLREFGGGQAFALVITGKALAMDLYRHQCQRFGDTVTLSLLWGLPAPCIYPAGVRRLVGVLGVLVGVHQDRIGGQVGEG
jgi:hypothetical protein